MRGVQSPSDGWHGDHFCLPAPVVAFLAFPFLPFWTFLVVSTTSCIFPIFHPPTLTYNVRLRAHRGRLRLRLGRECHFGASCTSDPPGYDRRRPHPPDCLARWTRLYRMPRVLPTRKKFLLQYSGSWTCTRASPIGLEACSVFTPPSPRRRPVKSWTRCVSVNLSPPVTCTVLTIQQAIAVCYWMTVLLLTVKGLQDPSNACDPGGPSRPEERTPFVDRELYLPLPPSPLGIADGLRCLKSA